ncbi:hypothetical protein BOX15_Mlig012368g1 [Macrostomum lignano]|uniref:G-protein coupled receptors family 1 profile domain-containing protein n=1 Tax=Macrostomum lignano TaxID=282301 RepID=A0A267FGM6_9PLAT|nr:hypothetical protein BOX15_Mlig012368g1 [Macrostomum lignano]
MSFSLAAANATEDPSGGGGQLLNSSSSSSPTTADSTGAVAARSLVLALLMAASCCTNVLLIIVLQYSRTLRRRSVYRLVCSVCVVNGLDTLLNCTVALGASITNGWPHPDWACRMSAFAVSMVDHLWLFSLLLLASDRLWALRDLDSYRRRFRVAPVSLAAFSIWAAAMALALPPAAAPLAVPSSYVSGRFVCGVGPAAPLAYVLACLCLGFLLPFATLCLLYVAIVAIGAKESERRVAMQTSTGYTQDRVPAPQTWSDLNLAKMTGALLAAWILLAGPYTVAVSIDRVKNSLELRDSLNRLRESADPAAETALFWLRVAFGPACPCLVLAVRPDVRRKLNQLASCKTPKSSNHVTDGPRLLHGGGEANGFHGNGNATGNSELSTRAGGDAASATLPDAGGAEADLQITDAGSEWEPAAETALAEPGEPLRVPVLFANSNGLHMQPHSSDQPVACDVADSRPDIRQAASAPSLAGQLGDISGDEEAKEAASSAAAAASAPTDPELATKDAEPQQALEEPQKPRRKKSSSGQEPAVAQKQKKKKKKKAAAAPVEPTAPAADSSFNSQSGLLVASGDLPDASKDASASAKRRPRRVRQNSVEPPPVPQAQQQSQPLPPCITKSPVRPKRRPDLPEVPPEALSATPREEATELAEIPRDSGGQQQPESTAVQKKKKRKRTASRTLPLMPQPVLDNSAFVSGDS